MSIVENNRSGFFPNSKEVQKSRADEIKRMRKPQVSTERNTPERFNEIKSLTSDDAKVKIPSRVKDFARIKKAVDAAPERDNSKKIQDLKSQINNGTYQINYDAIAERMLNRDY